MQRGAPFGALRFFMDGMANLLRASVLFPCLALLGGLFSGPADAGEKNVRFFRKKLQSDKMETLWYRYRPGRQGVFDHVAQVLAKQGMAVNKHYFLDRDDKNGILAVTGPPDTVETVIKLISFLDEKRPQVRISVQIAENVKSGDIQSGLDISWDRKTSERTFFRGFQMNNKPQSYLDSLISTSVDFQGTTTEFGTVDSQGNILDQKQYDRVGAITMSIRALSEYQFSDILAQPDILVTNGVKAEVFSGGKYPYQKITFHGTSEIISTDYSDVGVTLHVTPWVISKDKIKLSIYAKVTNVVGFVEISQGARNPLTDVREISDTVILDNGSKLSIGGLYQNENAVVEKGVPLLMDIPLLGLLFKSYWTTTKKKELLVFITPRIVEPSERFLFPRED